MSNPACEECKRRIDCTTQSLFSSCPAALNGTRIRVRLNFSDQKDWLYDDATIYRIFVHAGNNYYLILTDHYSWQRIPEQQILTVWKED